MTERIKLFNTLTRTIEDFRPLEEGRVGIYSCGPTVYNYAHIGNLRAYVFADILRRTFEFFGYDVKHVMNITDVGHLTDDGDEGEDKMELQSAKKGKSAWELADYYTEAFFRHSGELKIKRPHIVCKATDHIEEQIDMIKKLEDGGYIYKTSEGVYFDSSRFEKYGELARLKIEGLQEGQRVELGEKKSKTDFALWKFSLGEKKRQMEWESPWGKGFPGWHIECSAMATKFLGETIDIHTGGIDHIPVHHTNEIAQSECAHGKKFVNTWMHGEFLVLDGDEKMSKSKDNFLTVDKLIKDGFRAVEYRFFLLNAHYRSSLKFSYKNLEQSQNAYKKLEKQYLTIRDTPLSEITNKAQMVLNEFRKNLADDLNMPKVIAGMWSFLGSKELTDSDKLQLLTEYDKILGLELNDLKEATIPEEVLELAKQRDQARSEKDWGRSDELRDQIIASGYAIEDTKEGTQVIIK